MNAFDMDVAHADNGAVVVRITGNLDLYSAPKLRTLLLDIMDGNAFQLVLDCENLEYVDSAGLGVLISVLKHALQRSGTLLIASPQASVTRVFDITGLDKVFPIYASLHEALVAIPTDT